MSALEDTLRWLERAVIGLNLCPFAKAVCVKKQVHVVESSAEDANAVLEALLREADDLVALPAESRDTTLLVLTHCMHDFLDFNDVVARGERALRKRGFEGVLQLASFHPHFQFAGTDADDVTNNTNRAPWPTLHLLREESLDRAIAAFPDPAAIFEANMAKLRELGDEGWRALGVGRSP